MTKFKDFRLKTKLHFYNNKAEFGVIIQRSWFILANGITILMIPLFLTQVEQGFYYTFLSLVAIQTIFELGVGNVVIQFVSHEMAHITINSSKVKGDPTSIARLVELIRTFRIYYIVASVLFAILTSIGGIVFFRSTHQAELSNWIIPWMLIVIGSSIGFFLSLYLLVFEGQGYVYLVSNIRLKQSFFSHIIAWTFLILFGGLLSLSTIPILSSLITLYFINKHKKKTIDVIKKINIQKLDIKYWVEIWPFQWRIALSWASGYLISQIITPIIFKELGPIQAGRYGLSNAILNGAMILGISFVSSKTALFGMLVSRNKQIELIAIFKSSSIKTIMFTILILALGLICRIGIDTIYPDLGGRMVDVDTWIILSVNTMIISLILISAQFMRSYKEEPMLLPSLFNGFANLILIIILVNYGLYYISLGITTVTFVIILPWTLMLLNRYILRRNCNFI